MRKTVCFYLRKRITLVKLIHILKKLHENTRDIEVAPHTPPHPQSGSFSERLEPVLWPALGNPLPFKAHLHSSALSLLYGPTLTSIRDYWKNHCGSSGEEPTCQSGRRKRRRSNLWVKKIPWKGKWQPTPVFLPGKLQGRRSLAGYSP